MTIRKTYRDPQIEIGPRPAILQELRDGQIIVGDEVSEVLFFDFVTLDDVGELMEISALGNKKIAPSTNAGRWLKAILQVDTLPAEIDDRDLEGKPCIIDIDVIQRRGRHNVVYTNFKVVEVTPPKNQTDHVPILEQLEKDDIPF